MVRCARRHLGRACRGKAKASWCLRLGPSSATRPEGRCLVQAPDILAARTRGESVGCGCLLIAVGVPVAFVAYLFTGLADSYGVDHWWEEVILWAILLAGLAAVGWGVKLIVERPKD
jgi:hypothetical protein